MKKQINLTYTLSFLIPLFVIISSLYGIFGQPSDKPTYPDSFGPDTVSLITGIIFFICLLFERNNFFLKVVNLGILTYFIYINGCYCFSLLASSLFILYMAILSLSLYIFIFRISALINENIQINTNSKYPRLIISCFFIFVTLFMLKGELPYLIETTIVKHKSIIPYEVYIIFDLSFLFPALIITAILNLLKRQPSVILSGILLIKLITLMPAVFITDIFKFLQSGNIGNMTFDIIALIITLFSSILLFLHKRGLNT